MNTDIINEKCVKEFQMALKRNKSLANLKLEGCSFKEENCPSVFDDIGKNESLKELTLSKSFSIALHRGS